MTVIVFGAVLAASVVAQTGDEGKKAMNLPITKGPFEANDASLGNYKYPDWFRDAKFGIWSHWGPQAVPGCGDWYARDLYLGPGFINRRNNKVSEKGSGQYNYHLAHYGHPSGFGYKDIIPLWKAEKWDPQQLMELYKKAGAKYFVSMASHHDNFFLWNSKIHRWNSVNMGPKKDVVGLWQQAAQKQGLRFGVSEHLAYSYVWFQASHNADATGPKAGVPYDGNDPQYQDLYHTKAAPGDVNFARPDKWLTSNPKWHQRWFNVVKELVETYHPDLLYSDCKLPFGEVGRSMLANYYNQDIARNNGKQEAVYNCKEESNGKWVRDIENGVAGGISPYPWQTDTSIGDWFYRKGQKYRTAGEVVRMLIDIVSKNGNLLLNVVQTPAGDLEPDVVEIVNDIGAWMDINKEGIYSTRPWKVYGEGPAMPASNTPRSTERPSEKFHFTTSKDGTTLYAFEMAAPTGEVRIVSLARDGGLAEKPVASVDLLGSDEKLKWKQEAGALVIQKPAKIPNPEALAYRIRF